MIFFFICKSEILSLIINKDEFKPHFQPIMSLNTIIRPLYVNNMLKKNAKISEKFTNTLKFYMHAWFMRKKKKSLELFLSAMACMQPKDVSGLSACSAQCRHMQIKCMARIFILSAVHMSQKLWKLICQIKGVLWSY